MSFHVVAVDTLDWLRIHVSSFLVVVFGFTRVATVNAVQLSKALSTQISAIIKTGMRENKAL